MNRQVVGRRLAELRASRNISASDFAELIGWRRPRLSLVENGKAPLAFDALADFAEALDIPAPQLAYVLAGGEGQVAQPTLGPYGRGLLDDVAGSAAEVVALLDKLKEGLG